jgi:predicted nucleic acid-binding protein
VIVAVDTSVLILRERNAAVRAWFEPRLQADSIAVCDFVAMEYLVGARNGEDYDRIRDALGACLRFAVEAADWNRAFDVQRRLAHVTGGGQRSVKIPDLLIAASSERMGYPLVHYDGDYDRIAAVSGQATAWVVATGTA